MAAQQQHGQSLADLAPPNENIEIPEAPTPPVPLNEKLLDLWRCAYEMINTVDAIKERFGKKSDDAWAYYEAHVGGKPGLYNSYMCRKSETNFKTSITGLYSLRLANIILEAKGLPKANRVKEALATWNAYLASRSIGNVSKVGEGLPADEAHGVGTADAPIDLTEADEAHGVATADAPIDLTGADDGEAEEDEYIARETDHDLFGDDIEIQDDGSGAQNTAPNVTNDDRLIQGAWGYEIWD
ncbi:hypothetical protein N7G274_000068 [Stereocaulon virgatum]|uniref:Uncharacterized protein n=1 Tax=Stereocaulon virgatum TaxID=373712 RepID=A0ABR4AR37_9LECA